MLQVLAYADDVVMISRSVKELQNGFIQLEQEGRMAGTIINYTKIRYMIASRKGGKWEHVNAIQIGHDYFERITRLRYLEAIIIENMV